MFAKAVVVLASVSAALAVPFITSPVATTTFVGGQPATVKWQDNGSQPDLAAYGPCKISIYVGNALQQSSLQVITDNIDVSKSSSFDFTPDPKIGPNSNEYFVRIESLSLKDASSPYPAMAFSAKFTMSGMTGEFSKTAKDQIAGQTTAPLATPTASGTIAAASGSATASGMTTSKAASQTASASASASKKPSTSASSAASPLSASAGWASALLSALLGVTLF